MMNDDFDIRQEQMSSNEKEFENALRPLSFNDFSGQQQVVENLEVFVEAASGIQDYQWSCARQTWRFGRYPDVAGKE